MSVVRSVCPASPSPPCFFIVPHLFAQAPLRSRCFSCAPFTHAHAVGPHEACIRWCGFAIKRRGEDSRVPKVRGISVLTFPWLAACSAASPPQCWVRPGFAHNRKSLEPAGPDSIRKERGPGALLSSPSSEQLRMSLEPVRPSPVFRRHLSSTYFFLMF